MSRYRFGLVASIAAALLGSVSPMALSPAYAGVSRAAVSDWGRPEVAGDAGLADWLKKGLTSLATVFTNAGAAIVTNRMIQAGTAPKNIGWGIGTTTAAVAQTALVTESAPTTAGGRTVGTESRTTVTNTNDNYQVAGTVTATAALAITEAGTFDAVTAGNMLIRADFAAINVAIADSVAFTFGLKFVPG